MIPPALTQRLEELAPRHGIRLAIVFGSAVSGLLHERSDFDLALLLEGRPDLHRLAELEHELQESIPDRRLDLALINHADPLFLHEIMGSAELAYGSPEAFAGLRLYSFRRYHDHRRYLDMEREYVRRFVADLDAG
jgi:predicted nucleotidyltransferase